MTATTLSSMPPAISLTRREKIAKIANPAKNNIQPTEEKKLFITTPLSGLNTLLQIFFAQRESFLPPADE
jgi:hypothetical protein